jgi:membrane-bound lytic murein transglycosylase A
MKTAIASTASISSKMIQSPSMRQSLACLVSALSLALAACAPQSPPRVEAPSCPAPVPCPACPVCPAPITEIPKAPPLAPATFGELPGWGADDPREAWGAFRASCRSLRFREHWSAVCARADAVNAGSRAAVGSYFETNFVPYRLVNPDGGTQGLITGYYEPRLRGSRVRRAPYVHPLYAAPSDLLTIDLSAVAPETKHLRLRGRLDGGRVIPYYSRAEIEAGVAPVAGREIVYVDDPIEAFFLQIQGSGRVRLVSGEELRLGYADQNGHPYQSIGRYLVEKGELRLADASMQGIQAWARANPARLVELLNQNPSYVFFRELPPSDGGPIGALGVPLTAERSIAVDPRYVPLGAPVFLATARPNSNVPLARLMIAQDSGGAIRGPVRADFFWGTGENAGVLAGRMRQQGEMWVLLPREMPPPAGR